MRLVVLGATGNLGTALLHALAQGHPSWQVTGVARRLPSAHSAVRPLAQQWRSWDITAPDARSRLIEILAGADAVVNLVWAIQPTHDRTHLRWVNVGGTAVVLEAVAASGVGHLVHASSVAAYRPAPHKPVVDESAPREASSTSAYAQDKVETERLLDAYEAGTFLPAGTPPPDTVIARLRPALVLHGAAGAEIGRYFLGRLSAGLPLLSRISSPVVPLPRTLLVPVVAAADVADAVVRILERRAGGPFNLAADEPLDGRMFADAVAARPVTVPDAVVRALVSVSWHARLQPTDPGWFDVARNVPLLDTSRARAELGWQPQHRAADALADLLAAMANGAGGGTPVLAPRTPAGGPSEQMPAGGAPS